MQVAIITGSREAEEKMLGTLEELSKVNAGIEAKILPKDCTRADLEPMVKDSLADVFLIGSSMANTLSAHVANFTDGRSVVGVPLKDVKDPLPIYNEKPLPTDPYAITEVENITAAAELAVTILMNLREARA